MKIVTDRIAQAARDRADELRHRVRARIGAALPGVTQREEGERILLTGRELLRRWVRSDRLRDWRDINQ